MIQVGRRRRRVLTCAPAAVKPRGGGGGGGGDGGGGGGGGSGGKGGGGAGGAPKAWRSRRAVALLVEDEMCELLSMIHYHIHEQCRRSHAGPMSAGRNRGMVWKRTRPWTCCNESRAGPVDGARPPRAGGLDSGVW